MADMDVALILRLVDQVSGPAKQVAANLKSVQERAKSIGGVQKRMADVGTGMATIGRRMTLVTAPLAMGMAAAGATAFRGATQFQESMDQIVGLVGVARKEVDAWRGPMERVALRTTVPMQELGNAMFDITSAGLRGKTALEALERSATAAATGLGETRDIADVVTSAINTYGEAHLNAATATDVLAATVREGKADAASLAQPMKDVIAVAKQVGVRFDEVGAAMAAMTRQTGDAGKASTGLQGVLFKLMSPSETAMKQAKALGFSFEDVRRVLDEKGLLAALTFMHEKVGDNGDALRKLFEDREAIKGFLQLVGSNAKENAAIFERMADTTGTLDEAFAAAEKGGARAWAKMMVAINVAMIRLGNTLAPVLVPAIRKVADALQSATKWFTSLSDAGRAWTLAAAGIAVGIGPVTWALGGLIGGLAKVAGAFTALKAAGIGAALLNPVTIAMVALGAAAYAVYQNWEKVAPAWNALAEASGKVLASLRPIGNALDSVAQSMGYVDFSGMFEGWDEGVAGGVARILQGIADGLERIHKVIEAIKSGDVLGVFKNLSGAVSNLGPTGIIKNMLGLGDAGDIADVMANTKKGPKRGIAAARPKPSVAQVASRQVQDAAKASSSMIGDLKRSVSELIGSDTPAAIAAGAPVQGSMPPGFTIEAKGPEVHVNQAPPNIVNNITINVASPDQAPAATAEAVGRAISAKVQAGFYDGVHEH